ncbi:MAG: hypothetical protein MZW92_49930 [Comamonadaceae bacterium]|nr:hypothetical protein [Comamonadaceae bacterium]
MMPKRMAAPRRTSWPGSTTPDYLAAYAAAEAAGMRVPLADRERYALGTLENPYFEGFYTAPRDRRRRQHPGRRVAC